MDLRYFVTSVLLKGGGGAIKGRRGEILAPLGAPARYKLGGVVILGRIRSYYFEGVTGSIRVTSP